MIKNARLILGGLAIMVAASSCTSNMNSIREPFARVNWERKDFQLSQQVMAEATSTKIFGIDFARLFTRNEGEVVTPGALPTFASIPVVGNIITDKTANYALYNLTTTNTGYDVIFYPQFERYRTGIPIIFTKTKVVVRARMGKLQ